MSAMLDNKDSTAQSKDEPKVILVDGRNGSLGVSQGSGHLPLEFVAQLPLPGVVIFVHGVNSDGEWFQAAEEGLCKGLNTRMARNEGQILHCTAEGGTMKPVQYLKDLTPEGYLNPEKKSKTFIDGECHYSPVIHFRWGYKASARDLQIYGKGLYLNEKDYWGGGPFANGCTSIPDLWEDGLNDQMFLWIHAQHLNPTNDRMVYACPHRGYYVVAALRLARLIGEIRKKQADVPVTIVCHSQGNMVSIAAAFLGDHLDPVTDAEGKSGKCVANTYVLCNPPYSLLEENGTENWTQSSTGNDDTGYGRQTYEARIGTLQNFFKIIKQQAKPQQANVVDACSANEPHDFTMAKDTAKCAYGPGNANYGRVTLYFNPHDQVISAKTIQGIGWRGMDKKEIEKTGGDGVFCQRVFAQGFHVGGPKESYHFWNDHYVKGPDKKPLKAGSKEFWYPESPCAQYSIKKGMDANESLIPKILTATTALFLWPILEIARIRINGLPPMGWETPLTAPKLGKEGFLPQSFHLGNYSDEFDDRLDAPGFSRNAAVRRDANDPYGVNTPLRADPRHPNAKLETDAARGDENTESGLMYEHHAFLRMRARRDKEFVTDNGKVTQEENVKGASDDYKAWRTKKIQLLLAENVGTPATDHSSILTNPDHSEKALAFDIPVGVSHIAKDDLTDIRKMADWRFLDGLDESNPIAAFEKYFKSGAMGEEEVAKWVKEGDGAKLPSSVVNKRSRIQHKET